MASKQTGIGLYEFLIESELQQYYNALKNDLKVQTVTQLKYVSDEDMVQIGMSRPEIRRLKKFFQKHFPQTYLAKMKKKLRFRKDDGMSVASLSNYSPNAPGKSLNKSIAPGRHIIQAESIVIHKTLGQGEFGTVQQGVWTCDNTRTQVAIKCLSKERMENHPVEFLKEAAIMHSVDHEHIVRLYGVVLDTSALMLVTELAPLRSLLECLKEPSMHPNLGVPTLYDFAVQICDGMQYLESKRLIHRDLAARNILVFSRSKVKISDFGLSRALGVGKDYYQTNFNVNLKLPIAWCAPESINFLRFTSASDVWAYAVTLWEMFSYGFQPWIGMSGQQILEAIDEPNYVNKGTGGQRLEKPECCPSDIYTQIMLKCWQHDPLNRPTFVQLSHLILEYKPEQVQAIREYEVKPPRDSVFISYDAGDIITVLDRKPVQTSDDAILWKGVLKSGQSGLFDPRNTITYLGSSLPSAKSQSPFHRNDSRSSSMRKGRISADMISGPQGDLVHTGHVGMDGNFFGDITFLGSKSTWLPRQVVPPYKPESSSSWDASSSGNSAHGSRALNLSQQSSSSSRIVKDSQQDISSSSDTVPLLSCAQMSIDSSKGAANSSSSTRRRHNMIVSIPTSNYHDDNDEPHEYHEISDEENEIIGASGGLRESVVGLSNPALSSKSQSPLDSPRFEKTFDLDTGPSLIDEVFNALSQPHEAHNVKNELREMARAKKKKFVTVKPISSSDRRTLDHAIAIANELASRSMLDLDRSGKNGHNNNSLDDLSSPTTPTSPSHRRKFSFMLGGGKNDRERRNYSQEAASIPDIQSTLTDEAKEAYNSLVEKPSMNTLGFLTPSYENKSMSFHFPEKCSLSKKTDIFLDKDTSSSSNNVFHGPQSLTEMPGSCSNSNSYSNSSLKPNNHSHTRSRSLSKSEIEDENNAPVIGEEEEEEVDGNPLRLLRQNKQAMMTNVLPLPPRKDPRGFSTLTTQRHQRKHPLLIPNRISSLTSCSSSEHVTNSVHSSSTSVTATTTSTITTSLSCIPPAAPPKPQRLMNSNVSNKINSLTDHFQPLKDKELQTNNNSLDENNTSSPQQAQPQQETKLQRLDKDEISAPISVPFPRFELPQESSLNKLEMDKENRSKSVMSNMSSVHNKNCRSQGPVLLYENVSQDTEEEKPKLESISNNSTLTFGSNNTNVSNTTSATSINNSSNNVNTNNTNTNNYLEEECATTTLTESENVALLPSSRPSSESSIMSSSNSITNNFNRISATNINLNNSNATSSSGRAEEENSVFRMNSFSKNIATEDQISSSSSSNNNSNNNMHNNNSSNNNGNSNDHSQQEKRISTFPTTTTLPSYSSTVVDSSSEMSTQQKSTEPLKLITRKIPLGNSIKIKTLQRILGPSTSEEECNWALEATKGDSAHAVKLIRLKSLLPDNLITEDATELREALDMNFWDVARGCSYLLSKNSNSSGSKSSTTALRGKLRMNLQPYDSNNLRQSSNTGDDPNNIHSKSYIRPNYV